MSRVGKSSILLLRKSSILLLSKGSIVIVSKSNECMSSVRAKAYASI